MTADPTDPLEAVRRENRVLRERVAELERQLQRFGEAQEESPALGASLSEREALLSEAERIAHMGSWVWDVNSNDVYWSDELFRILGYDSRRERASTEAFFAAVHPEDRERVRATSVRGVSSGVSEQQLFRVLRPTGEVRHVTMDGALLFDSAGDLKRAVGTVLDVTEARHAALEVKKTAELLAEAQAIGKMGSFELDLVSGELSWSAEVFRILDVEPTEPASFATFMRRVHPDDRGRVSELNTQEQFTETARARVVHRDQSLHHVEMTAVARYDDEGRMIAVHGTVSDVTRVVELEAQFHQSQKMEAVGQLAGGLAHDYNNLLTVILGNAELLMEDDESQELKEIVGAARAATGITNRLLTFSRHQHRTARIACLNDEVSEAKDILLRALGELSELVIEVEPGPLPVLVESGQVQQILLNLTLNARDAMPEGGTFTVSVANRELSEEKAALRSVKPGAYVTITVTDTGVGMDEATLARIFEPFFSTKPPHQGTGLGLAMVFGAMKLNGGFVEAESMLGKGASFRLWFPSVLAQPDETESPRPRVTPHQVKVLLVEDSGPVARVACTILKLGGHQVRVAQSARQALAMWQEEPADALVTDVVMPEMSGVALADQLRKVAPHMPVLFITGYLPERVGLEEQPGRSGVVMKPFRGRELLSALDDLLEQARS